MKAIAVISGIAVVGTLGFFLISRNLGSHPTPASPGSPGSAGSFESQAPTAILTEPTAIFKRAFWRAPSAGDEILHAERREWADAGGVTKWQWFIVVKASPELLKYLRDDNAFGLIPAKAALLPDEKPQWFSFNPNEVAVLKSRHGKMQLVFQTQDNTLYASDAGGGFQRGAPEPTPAHPDRPAPSPGRLPNTPPPRPES